MNIVAFVEGGILQSVIDLDAPKPELGIEYTVVDYDMFEEDPAEDIIERWRGYSPELQEYFKYKLPDEYEMFVEVIRNNQEKE